jgi:hypothetical protein
VASVVHSCLQLQGLVQVSLVVRAVRVVPLVPLVVQVGQGLVQAFTARV